MPPNEVFLSHSNADRPFADTLAEAMRRHGVPVGTVGLISSALSSGTTKSARPCNGATGL